jgi:predicted Zn-dependent peptidase
MACCVRRRALAAGAVALALGTAAILAQGPPAPSGQGVPPSAGLVRKSRAPVSRDVLRVALPKPQEAQLSSGLRLMVLEDRRLPRVSFQIVIPGAGGYYDPAGMVGLSSYTAQMMREGTTTRTSQQISQELETMAASLSVGASTSGWSASISGGSLSEHFDALFGLAADVLLNPSFPEDEWNRLKARTRTQLTQQRAQPGFLAAERFSRLVYADHPAGRISATPATLDAITRAAMVDTHRTRFVPDHAVIAFAGDLSMAAARQLVDARLRSWKKAGAAKPAVSEPAPPEAAKVQLVVRPNSVQTNLTVGAQSLARSDPDFVPLTVANRILGGPMGRLFRDLREQKGYTYGVGSSFSALSHRGAWQAGTSVRNEVTEPALRDLLGHLRQMIEQPVDQAELDDAKRGITGSFALALENPQQVLGYYLEVWQYGLPKSYWEKYPAMINAVTAEQVQRVAKKYWDPARLNIVAVGNADVAAILKANGSVELFDTEGGPRRP